MKQQIAIPEPCSVEWDSMKTSEQGRYCQVCATQVIDFSDMPLEDIVTYLNNNSSQKVCGRYHERHTDKAGWWLQTVNLVEAMMLKLRIKRLATLVVAGLLFFSNCARRRLSGAYSMNHNSKPAKEILAKKPTRLHQQY